MPELETTPSASSNKGLHLLIYGLFALSGFFGLCYEGLWAHYLKLLFGHSVYGQIFTLVCLLGGIGVGSFIGGKIAQKTRHPFKCYA